MLLFARSPPSALTDDARHADVAHLGCAIPAQEPAGQGQTECTWQGGGRGSGTGACRRRCGRTRRREQGSAARCGAAQRNARQHSSVPGEQHVAALAIQMDDVPAVQVDQRSSDVQCDLLASPVPVHRPRLQVGRQVAALRHTGRQNSRRLGGNCAQPPSTTLHQQRSPLPSHRASPCPTSCQPTSMYSVTSRVRSSLKHAPCARPGQGTRQQASSAQPECAAPAASPSLLPHVAPQCGRAAAAQLRPRLWGGGEAPAPKPPPPNHQTPQNPPTHPPGTAGCLCPGRPAGWRFP